MKRMVQMTGSAGPPRMLLLMGLAALPSGWTAHVEIARSLSDKNPQVALQHAVRAVRKNSAVWQGHHQRVSLLEQDGQVRAAVVARLVAVALMGPSSVEAAGSKWFPEISNPDRASIAARCSVSPDMFPEIVSAVLDIGGPERSACALERLADILGANVLNDAVGIEEVVPVEQAIDLAKSLRKAGAVDVPLSLLERYRLTPDLETALIGARQDAEALRGRFNVEVGSGQRYRSRPDTSLYLLHNALPHDSGGYATRSHGLLGGLRTHGHEAVPVTRPGFPAVKYVFDQDPTTPDFDVVEGVLYHHLLGPVPSQPRSDLQGFVDLYVEGLDPLIRGYRPSVIHAASNWWNGFAAVSAARTYGVASIYEIRGLWEVTRSSRIDGWQQTERYQVDANYETEVALRADRVIAITGGLRDEMVRRGVPEEKITVVPNAVDLSKFRPLPRDDELATSLGINDEVVVGFAGTLTFYEGLDDLLRAGVIVKNSSKVPFRFLFVGDGPMRTDMQSLALELGLSDNCIFTGRVLHSEVGRYLSLMAITPFPRKALPVCEMVSPLKPLESMATGTAVLGSDVQALRELIPTGAGLTFAKGDVADLAEKLKVLIEDSSFRAKLVSNAHNWVAGHRTWERVSQPVVDLYRELS